MTWRLQIDLWAPKNNKISLLAHSYHQRRRGLVVLWLRICLHCWVMISQRKWQTKHKRRSHFIQFSPFFAEKRPDICLLHCALSSGLPCKINRNLPFHLFKGLLMAIWGLYFLSMNRLWNATLIKICQFSLCSAVIDDVFWDFKILKDQIKVQCHLANVERVFSSFQQIQPFNFFWKAWAFGYSPNFLHIDWGVVVYRPARYMVFFQRWKERKTPPRGLVLWLLVQCVSMYIRWRAAVVALAGSGLQQPCYNGVVV